jgi:hypothetical protein
LLIEGLAARRFDRRLPARLTRVLEPGPECRPDFRWLILFGYADSLACRGPELKSPVTDMARKDLALLALEHRLPDCQRWDQGRAARGATLRAVVEVLQEESGVAPGVLLSEQGRRYDALRRENEKAGTTPVDPPLEVVLTAARSILERLRRRPEG